MSGVICDKTINEILDAGIKIIDPIEEISVQPASIDLRLGNVFYEYSFDNYILGQEIDDNKDSVKKEFSEKVINPGESIFVSIYERFNIPSNLIGLLMARSSITRLGIQILPKYLNPGYSGWMPITVFNGANFNITLKPGIRVAQLILMQLDENPERDYFNIDDSKYMNEQVKVSKLHEDSDIKDALDQVTKSSFPTFYHSVSEAK